MSDEELGVTWSKVESYLRQRLDATFSMNGANSPRVDYVVLGQEIELRVELVGHQRPPVSRMPMIKIDEVTSRNTRVVRLRTADPVLRRDFHDLICAIAERIVIHRQRLDQALTETLHAWSALLQGPRVLRQQHAIGLLGELAVLWALGTDQQIGWARAADAWLGSANEEHDFALTDYDIEVKTTSLSKPIHTIHGISQLTPKPGRPLWLVSLQLTRGGGAGVSLTALGRAVRREFAAHSIDRVIELDEVLAFVDEQAQEDDRWLLAAPSMSFGVGGDFPRIDDSTLTTLLAAHRPRIDLISYRVDLTGLSPSADAPPALLNVSLPDLRTT